VGGVCDPPRTSWPRHTFGLRPVEYQHHEYVIGNLPLARDAQRAGGREPEARIELRISEDDDERAPGFSEPPVPGGDELAADALATANGVVCNANGVVSNAFRR
jgi:hypothetical protein